MTKISVPIYVYEELKITFNHSFEHIRYMNILWTDNNKWIVKWVQGTPYKVTIVNEPEYLQVKSPGIN